MSSPLYETSLSNAEFMDLPFKFWYRHAARFAIIIIIYYNYIRRFNSITYKHNVIILSGDAGGHETCS